MLLEVFQEHNDRVAQLVTKEFASGTLACLREIADLCGVQKQLTFHCARHTFATTVTLTNGVPIETVSKKLGIKI